MKKPIYLDYAATTPVDERVAEKMLKFLTSSGEFGNSSSAHIYGQNAKHAIEEAREKVAALINADANEIIWTSGATESDNLALRGVTTLYKTKGKHLVTLNTEHPAVLDCFQQLEKEGFSITYLDVEKNGLVNLEKFKACLRDDTILVSIMHVNNEIGVIQDIESIAKITADKNILLHVDATQSMGKVTLDTKKLPIDLISFSAHKLYGPKGIGALYVRKKPRVRVAAQIFGGGQEQGMRSGTLATHQIVGMGEAFYLAKQLQQDEFAKILNFKKKLWDGISSSLNVMMNGDWQHTVPHILNLQFKNKRATEIMRLLPELAISAGSACQSKGTEPSLVLRALGLSNEEAQSSLRFSFGRFTTEDEIGFAIECMNKKLS